LPHVHVFISEAHHEKLLLLKEIFKKKNIDDTITEMVERQYKAEVERQ
jgi:hypothetical protein